MIHILPTQGASGHAGRSQTAAAAELATHESPRHGLLATIHVEDVAAPTCGDVWL
jgi:hypothetical protein